LRLEGRRIWFVGIGGAGLSGYAVLAKAWGAEVAGWDRHETPEPCLKEEVFYMELLADAQSRTRALLAAPDDACGASVAWDVRQLPCFIAARLGRDGKLPGDLVDVSL